MHSQQREGTKRKGRANNKEWEIVLQEVKIASIIFSVVQATTIIRLEHTYLETVTES